MRVWCLLLLSQGSATPPYSPTSVFRTGGCAFTTWRRPLRYFCRTPTLLGKGDHETRRSRGNLVVYRPEDLFPQTQLVWESFCGGEIDEESVRYRLEIIRPLAVARGCVIVLRAREIADCFLRFLSYLFLRESDHRATARESEVPSRRSQTGHR
jgi:hypothetical protein